MVYCIRKGIQVEQMGYNIKKGEKSTEIFFFKPLEIEVEMENINTGETEKVKKTIPMLKSYRVFNIEQTDAELEEDAEISKVETIKAAEDFFNNIDFIDIVTHPKPFYSPARDTIYIPHINDFTSSSEYYSTLGHELIHSTGHRTRLKRDLSGSFGSDSYSFEELIAELGSVLLMAHLKLDAEPIQNNSAAYLKSWLTKLKSDPKQLWRAANEATKAALYLIEFAEQKETTLNKKAA